MSFAQLGCSSTLTRMPLRSQTESDVMMQCYPMQRDTMQRNAGANVILCTRLKSSKKGSVTCSKAVIVLSEEKRL